MYRLVSMFNPSGDGADRKWPRGLDEALQVIAVTMCVPSEQHEDAHAEKVQNEKQSLSVAHDSALPDGLVGRRLTGGANGRADAPRLAEDYVGELGRISKLVDRSLGGLQRLKEVDR